MVRGLVWQGAEGLVDCKECRLWWRMGCSALR